MKGLIGLYPVKANRTKKFNQKELLDWIKKIPLKNNQDFKFLMVWMDLLSDLIKKNKQILKSTTFLDFLKRNIEIIKLFKRKKNNSKRLMDSLD